MKDIITKNGQIFEVLENLSEVRSWIFCLDIEELGDDTLYIEYKDGSKVFAGWNGEVEGKMKKTGIKTVIYNNDCTSMVYGEYRIYNLDDVDEEYSEENDAESKDWGVE